MELNNIYLGDAYKLIKEIPDKSVDLIMTDPPYQIDGLEAKTRHMTGMFKNRNKTHVHEMAETKLGDGIDLKILDEFVRVMKKINIYLWCNKEQIYDYLTYFVKEKKCNFEIIVWAKPNPAPFTNGHYLKDKEYCLFFREKGVKVGGDYHSLKTYYVKGTNTEDKDNYLHPTIKPIDIIENLIKNSCGGGLQLPQILVMENVPEVIGSANIGDFHKWEHRLEELGYKNYVEILNAKNYGIPQNRRRCFMVSILGEYAYNFPIKLKREYRLKDLLEKVVAKKYYLTDEHIERISNWKAQQKPLENMQNNVLISPTLTARGAGEDHSGMVLIDTELFEEGEVVDFDSSDEFRREHSTEETPSLLTHPKLAVVEKDNDESNGGIPIVEATKKGYKVAHDGDGVDIGGRMKSHRGTVQKGLAQTLKTDCDVGVVVEDEEN